MKLFISLFSLIFILVACNEKDLENQVEVTSHEVVVRLNLDNPVSEIRSEGDCIVKGECSSFGCHASIECGCDESPKCSCTWSVCKCDCQKKGSAIVVNPMDYSIDVFEEYFDNLNSLTILSNNSLYEENQKITKIVDDILNAIYNNDLELYSEVATHLYDFVHSISEEQAKDEINSFFIDSGIEDEI